jgi:hypothetical protein
VVRRNRPLQRPLEARRTGFRSNRAASADVSSDLLSATLRFEHSPAPSSCRILGVLLHLYQLQSGTESAPPATTHLYNFAHGCTLSSPHTVHPSPLSSCTHLSPPPSQIFSPPSLAVIYPLTISVHTLLPLPHTQSQTRHGSTPTTCTKSRQHDNSRAV